MISVLHFNIFHIDLLHTCTYKTKTKSRIRSSGGHYIFILNDGHGYIYLDVINN
jgi:hypothetical protein